eukprot:TRINITY_DN2968_c0_g1_i9.p1 TRINITY_DN2968_c0_g1~~TRINITY_DN2968_c0_g1_i9.p1  ORF type:complete len:908 (+),score=199.39 TRINITY_DN2968_c0_g1_i9:1954-4677(+)
MCHRVKVLPSRTFRFNECVCTPYNADFDGDEMNLHVPQTQEARAEAMCLMSSVENLATPKDGSILIAATQDFLTTSFLLTSKDRFYDRSEFSQICSHFSDGRIKFDLPEPTIIKPIELFTGKQVFSVLIRHSAKDKNLVNLERKNKNYDNKANAGVFDALESYVCIRNGELLCGVLDKSILGGGKNNLFQLLLRDYGNEICSDRMTKLARLSARWIGDQGFSIGIDDVTPGDLLKLKKEKLISDAYAECDQLIEQVKLGRMQPDPGCSLDLTLENRVSGVLSKVRDDMGVMCSAELPAHNSPLIMTLCGSKGSKMNISQMVASVGQQIVAGSRIPNGFQNRTLPHFKLTDARSPEAKGFVAPAFFNGLEPPEFFFHTMGGREGLIDTAVKTAETGYMQRRLMKALEDLSVEYDGSVRTSSGWIAQFTYGDDGIEPTYVEDDKAPVNPTRLIVNILNQNTTPGTPVTEEEKQVVVEKIISTNEDLLLISNYYKDHLRSWLNKPENIVDRHRLDENALTLFLQTYGNKMRRAMVEPGTAVGALAAQSIGEPCTQMTLKTFHFAGVASMNISLGVPRIKEIIDASHKIKTPFISAQLLKPKDEREARRVKGLIERVVLHDIVDYMAEVFGPSGAYLEIKIDWELVNALFIKVTLKSIIDAIIAQNKILRLGLKEDNVDIGGKFRDKIIILPSVNLRKPNDQDVIMKLYTIKNKIGSVVVTGIPSVSRCVMTKKKDKGREDEHELWIDGTGLLSVLQTPGVDPVNTMTNHSIEAAAVLGIEAGRQVIINQIAYTMSSHGITVDERHLKLLADMMTFKGKILGMQRTGISEMTNSVLMLASFERTDDILETASLHSMKDNITGVSEGIIMGKTVSLGTGKFGILASPAYRTFRKNSTLLQSNFNLSLRDMID